MDEPLTLAFETFWSWVMSHPNCILRAGTPETVLYDDEDLHWHFAAEGPQTLVVQVIRGKRLMGELLIEPEHVTYVQGSAGDREEEFVFELISETEAEQIASYFFVLTHGYEPQEPTSHPPSSRLQVH
jgi:hypothetical protein